MFPALLAFSIELGKFGARVFVGTVAVVAGATTVGAIGDAMDKRSNKEKRQDPLFTVKVVQVEGSSTAATTTKVKTRKHEEIDKINER